LNNELDTQITSTRQAAPAKPKTQVKAQPMPVQPVQVQPVAVATQPTQSKSPQPEPFPSEHKAAITQRAYDDTRRKDWIDGDMDEDEARDWKISWGIK
jgi:hypothetical protein